MIEIFTEFLLLFEDLKFWKKDKSKSNKKKGFIILIVLIVFLTISVSLIVNLYPF